MNKKVKNMVENMENGHKNLIDQATGATTTWRDKLHNIKMPSKKVMFTALGAVTLIGAGVAYQLMHKKQA